jgi:asparaginyl-tRNA synthetase
MRDLLTATHATISDLGSYEGQLVEIRGWLYNKRSKGKLQFLLVRDGTGTVQSVLFKPEVEESSWQAAETLTQESSCVIRGIVKKDDRAPGGYELNLQEVKAIQIAGEYPISPKEHGTDFLMNHRHLWLRSKRQNAILRIRSGIVRAMRNWMDEHGFVLIDAPILTPAACEGTSTLFETDYFGDKAYLTQSGQLYSEAAAMAFGRVYCFGPTFRAEKSKTRRHLTEFWMLEPEMAYTELEESLEIQENFVSHVVQTILKDFQPELGILERNLSKLESILPPFPRLSYDDAVAILQKEGSGITWGDDLGGTDETVLASRYDRPVFVTHYPAVCKAFYMKEDPERPEVVRCADLLAPEGYGEIIGGSQREDNLDVLLRKMREHDIRTEAYEWYLDLRRYGSVPHSGVGIGLELTVAWICGLEHVRETAPFPRMLTRIYP